MTYIGIIINQEVHVRARKEVFADSFTRNCSEGNLWHYTACDPFGKSQSGQKKKHAVYFLGLFVRKFTFKLWSLRKDLVLFAHQYCL